ncbi:putative sulfate transporter [Penicillium brasilianum]|uniref:Putative sulfate transporter n=1 Tax=Penicillium brasilianum TaxID=104259 RepID=A0A1S9RR19_PENBI|nr:putative sulfate transporter [Penicillium brasilianum]
MSESSPLLRQGSEGHRSLQNRIIDILRTPGSRRASPGPDSRDGGRGLGITMTSEPDARARLLESYHQADPICGERRCSHGTFSPRPEGADRQDYPVPSSVPFGYNGDGETGATPSHSHGGDDQPGSRPDSEYTAQMKSSLSALSMNEDKKLYISYYIPFFNWISQYRWSFLRGDLIAALTISSIYIPMALSLASNLAHAPPVNGLYSFVIHPFVYAILGSCPLLVIGPEAAGSLLTGAIVKASLPSSSPKDDDLMESAIIIGISTAMAGAMILVAGITRLGFLDNVLSRPFLRGFITAIGFVIFVDQLIPELGLAGLAKEGGASHGTTVEKLTFIIRNAGSSHGLTATVSLVSFSIIMFFRTLKKWMMPRFPQVIYFPDRFIVVVLSAVLAYSLNWEDKGLELLGHTEISSSQLFAFNWPFRFDHMNHIRTAMSKAFIITLLGFFESSVAAKGLGDSKPDGIQGMHMSANREMVALGVANLLGGCFMSLPAFGGYGRSKVNAQTGARTPMSSIFLSLITLVAILVLLPYLYYLPKAVLSSMISVVAYTLVEECPHDIVFFLRLRGWTELVLMLLIFTSTIFYSLELGMALGIGLSVIILIRHATQPRIQILGKVPGTHTRFENAELQRENVELIEGALIVKIPEPLTFANTGDLKNRLRRLELYGSSRTHPSRPRMRPAEYNKNIIFDVHGVTSIDGSGTQVLSEIVRAYAEDGVRVFFCRVPNSNVFRMFELSGIVEQCGGLTHFVPHVDEALRLAETEEQTEI